MRKIKLVLSDLHISGGRILEDGSPNLLEDFFYDRDLMDFLAWFSTEEYRKTDVELILNGDFLNTLQVDLREKTPTLLTEQLSLQKVQAIIHGHSELFGALREFVQTPNHRLTVIPGNHDPAFFWPAVRDSFGAFFDREVRFPMFIYRFDGFHIEHGNQHTVINSFEPKSLFVHKGVEEPVLNLPWGALFIINYLNKAKSRRNFIDKVKPLRRYLIGAMFIDPLFGWPAMALLILFFIRTRLIPEHLNSKDLRHSLRMLSEGFRLTPNLEAVAKRILFADPDIHTVIMGHSHIYAHRRFRVDKEYFNTGTWNDAIHLDIQNLGKQRKLSFVMINYPDKDRPHASLLEWKGISRPFVPVEF